MTTAAVVAEIASQVDVVSKYFPRFSSYQDDITQEAWAASLAMADRFDPSNPGAAGFFKHLAYLWLCENIDRWISPVSMSRDEARAGTGKGLYGGELKTAATVVDAPAVDELRAEIDELEAGLMFCIRKAVTKARLTDVERAVGFALRGMGGPARTRSWVATKLGVSRAVVAKAERRFEEAVGRSEKAAEIAAQIEQLQDQIERMTP